jgi:O-succinylbenzoic acid--CoA ligase
MGYYNSSSQEIDPFPNGVFRTSDLGVIHNGKLEVLGRADEVINSGGEKISLIALENFLSEMFIGVQFCAVGLPDAKWGEVLMLAYSTPTHFSIETGDISRAIEEEFETYYLPKSIKKVESLPTLGIGKIDRKAVRQLFL